MKSLFKQMNSFAEMYISTVHEKAPEYILGILAIPAGAMNLR